nr:MAG TPA: hypothetical protein [Caudoviricetes sp.]
MKNKKVKKRLSKESFFSFYRVNYCTYFFQKSQKNQVFLVFTLEI